jgi:hypothetical protein
VFRAIFQELGVSMQAAREQSAVRFALRALTFKPPSSSRCCREQSDSAHARRYSAHRRTYTSAEVAPRLHSGRQLDAMRLPSGVLRQQLWGEM